LLYSCNLLTVLAHLVFMCVCGAELESEDHRSEAIDKLADLSVVNHKKQYDVHNGMKDEEQNQEQASVVVNNNGVCDLCCSLSLHFNGHFSHECGSAGAH